MGNRYIIKEVAVRHSTTLVCFLVALLIVAGNLALGAIPEKPLPQEQAMVDVQMRKHLDAPLLFTKRHSYTGIHIYDTYYKWPPGGGGIYVLENPAAPRSQWKIRPIIDPATPETLGEGVYNDPELSWDATKLLFCFKGEPQGSTSIYEIGVDGTGLRRVSDPTETCDVYKGSHGGQHDVTPAYLADGRIVFLTTRPSGLVPCANSGVAIMHVMNADGSDIHPISVNNVNEFDPALLPDGRLLFGRWEYVDKNALTIQSLWTMNPDGTQETAFYANNMVFPEAILDARPVPNSHFVVGTFAKHNSTPRGSIALVDPRLGKNDPKAIVNLEHPEEPTFDRGDSCEPWPVSEDTFVFSGRPAGHQRNVLEMIDRAGNRILLHSDPEICLHSPMLLKPRPRPATIRDAVDRTARSGRFFLQDIYKGLKGVKRGEVKALRVLEETSRTSERSGGSNPYNQTFLVSSALAFSVKNFLGMVPVEEDGSAYFEVPAGRAVFLQALDSEGRLIQSMRTFVQAAPGMTRSCIGCHEHKYSTTAAAGDLPPVLGRKPSRLAPESWGSGYLDYASMVQPVLDRRCVSCHGGEEGIGGGMDLSGGWTEHFSASYENLTNRRETQLEAYWIAGIDCMNGTALWSSQLFPPRGHGSGAAPLADVLVGGHDGQISDLTRQERDLLMAWIDTNGLYYGTWNTTPNGCAILGWGKMRNELTARMKQAGCLDCHGDGNNISYFENDWVNLQKPELSRILRAPLAAKEDGGLGWCRQQKVDASRQRVHLLWRGYAHAVQPPEAFPRRQWVPSDRSGEPVVSFASTSDSHYQAMLQIIKQTRADALASPRVDMPGANVVAGECRLFLLPAVTEEPPPLSALVDEEGVVLLTWEPSAMTIGLDVELHRSGNEGFVPAESTLLARTPLLNHVDQQSPVGKQHYAIVLVSDEGRSRPAYASVDVPPLPPPPAPEELTVVPASCAVRLQWKAPNDSMLAYNVHRAKSETGKFEKITPEPIRQTFLADAGVEHDVPYVYQVRSVNRRGTSSETGASIQAVAKVIKEPIFVPLFDGQAQGRLYGGPTLSGKIHGAAKCTGGMLDLTQGGHVTFPHDVGFELTQPISVECWVRFDQPGKIPVLVSCGHWQQAGWFLQRLGGTWRWHVGGIDCDGGRPAEGRWIHLVAVCDGKTARLFEDGQLVGEQTGPVNTATWPGDLHVGQYSGTPGAEFQVTGRMTGVKIYHRPLDVEEISQAAQTRPE